MKPNLNLNSAARTRRASDATEGQEGQEPPRRNVAPPPRRPVGGVDVMTARSESGAPSWSQVILPADLSDRLDPLGTSGSDTSSEADEGHSGSGRSTPEAPAASGDPLERATAATGGRPRPAWATDPRIRFSRGSNSESSSGGQESSLSTLSTSSSSEARRGRMGASQEGSESESSADVDSQPARPSASRIGLQTMDVAATILGGQAADTVAEIVRATDGWSYDDIKEAFQKRNLGLWPLMANVNRTCHEFVQQTKLGDANEQALVKIRLSRAFETLVDAFKEVGILPRVRFTKAALRGIVPVAASPTPPASASAASTLAGVAQGPASPVSSWVRGPDDTLRPSAPRRHDASEGSMSGEGDSTASTPRSVHEKSSDASLSSSEERSSVSAGPAASESPRLALPTLSDEIERILALLPKSSAAGSGPWAYAQHLAEGLAGTDFQRIILGLREQGHEIADAVVDFVLALSRVEEARQAGDAKSAAILNNVLDGRVADLRNRLTKARDA
jgi:hypothetical protein